MLAATLPMMFPLVWREARNTAALTACTQSGFRPAEVKYQPKPVQLVKVESNIRLSCDWYGHLHGNTSQALLKNVQVYQQRQKSSNNTEWSCSVCSLQATVRGTVDKVFSHALLKVNSRFVDEGDPLIVKPKKGEQLPTDVTVELDIFTKHVREASMGIHVTL